LTRAATAKRPERGVLRFRSPRLSGVNAGQANRVPDQANSFQTALPRLLLDPLQKADHRNGRNLLERVDAEIPGNRRDRNSRNPAHRSLCSRYS